MTLVAETKRQSGKDEQRGTLRNIDKQRWFMSFYRGWSNSRTVIKETLHHYSHLSCVHNARMRWSEIWRGIERWHWSGRFARVMIRYSTSTNTNAYHWLQGLAPRSEAKAIEVARAPWSEACTRNETVWGKLGRKGEEEGRIKIGWLHKNFNAGFICESLAIPKQAGWEAFELVAILRLAGQLIQDPEHLGI